CPSNTMISAENILLHLVTRGAPFPLVGKLIKSGFPISKGFAGHEEEIAATKREHIEIFDELYSENPNPDVNAVFAFIEKYSTRFSEGTYSINHFTDYLVRAFPSSSEEDKQKILSTINGEDLVNYVCSRLDDLKEAGEKTEYLTKISPMLTLYTYLQIYFKTFVVIKLDKIKSLQLADKILMDRIFNMSKVDYAVIAKAQSLTYGQKFWLVPEAEKLYNSKKEFEETFSLIAELDGQEALSDSINGFQNKLSGKHYYSLDVKSIDSFIRKTMRNRLDGEDLYTSIKKILCAYKYMDPDCKDFNLLEIVTGSNIDALKLYLEHGYKYSSIFCGGRSIFYDMIEKAPQEDILQAFDQDYTKCLQYLTEKILSCEELEQFPALTKCVDVFNKAFPKLQDDKKKLKLKLLKIFYEKGILTNIIFESFLEPNSKLDIALRILKDEIIKDDYKFSVFLNKRGEDGNIPEYLKNSQFKSWVKHQFSLKSCVADVFALCTLQISWSISLNSALQNFFSNPIYKLIGAVTSHYLVSKTSSPTDDVLILVPMLGLAAFLSDHATDFYSRCSGIISYTFISSAILGAKHVAKNYFTGIEKVDRVLFYIERLFNTNLCMELPSATPRL
ncbi:MAG: hypothetical protein LW825_02335, partial [Candidatus Jidaibacter sp.]|nr:hypothetical protein [Candidatus Jidaibacter sp.]